MTSREEVDINKKNIIIILSVITVLLISLYLSYRFYNKTFIPKIVDISKNNGYISRDEEDCVTKDCLILIIDKINTGLIIELNIIGENNNQYSKNISNIKSSILNGNYWSAHNVLIKLIYDKNNKVNNYLATNENNFVKIKKYLIELGYNPRNYLINGEYSIVSISGGDSEDGNILLKKTTEWNILRGPYTYLEDLELIESNSIIRNNINTIYEKPILNYFSEKNFISGLIEIINIINYENNVGSISNILPYSDEGFDIRIKNEDTLFVTIYANSEDSYKLYKTAADRWINLNKKYINSLQIEYFRESAADVE